MRIPARLCCGLGLAIAVGTGIAQPVPELQINALSDDAVIEYDETEGTVTDPAGVRVTYGDASLTARRITLDRRTAAVEAEGSVRLERGKELWTGERLRYNFSTREILAQTFRTGVAPFFAAGDGLAASLGQQTHSATNGFVTTDDVAEPGYRVKAKQLVFVPGQYIEARGATLYLGRVPVLYLPRYRRHLDRHPNYFVFVPGYRSLYGAYLLTTYNMSLRTNVTAAAHVDFRVKRGVGGGPDLTYDLGRWGEGEIQTYFTRDEEPGEGWDGRPIDDFRERIRFAHSAYITTNLTARLVLNQQSDAYFLRDYFEGEYRRDTQPKSFLEVSQYWPNFSLDFLTRPQVNDFFQTVERLPDVKLTGLRQQLGISPFYYESESSLAYLRLRAGDFFSATNYAAWRGDTYHQLLVPQTLWGWLNVTPRVGGRYTYYGEQEGEGTTLNEQDRWVLNTGAELSMKASRVWQGTQNRLLDVNGLRHIVEPSLNYVFVPDPSARPPELPQFDDETYSLELQPIDFPDYSSIDTIDSQNVIRFGLRNKLQTKRGGEIDNLVNWALFMDWRLQPRPDQRTFSDLFSDLDFKPRSWLTLNSEVRYDINETLWRLAYHTATIEPNDRWAWKVGHRYLRDIESLGPDSGSNLLISSLHLRLNENWGFRLRHHYEIDDEVMQEQYYTIYRDFRSWTGALTLRLRDNQDGEDDVTVAFTLSLKAVPRYKLGQDRDEPWLLLGY